MANNRTDEVVSAIVDNVREALIKKNVTWEEYRGAVAHIMKTTDAGELPLLIDLFFNATVCRIENSNNDAQTSASDMEGPYFIEDVPEVDGKMMVLDDDTCEPMLCRGTVRDTQGNPLPGVTVFVWSSTHDGRYGGIHGDLPKELYRAKLTTDAEGCYQVESRVPVPYHIKDDGPTGDLLRVMGRHSWRPAHVHYKVRYAGFQELTTQAYFEGGDYVHDDCCEGTVPSDHIKPRLVEDGKVVMEVDFVIQRAAQSAAA